MGRHDMSIIENANAGHVFLLRMTKPTLTILFVDETEFCQDYISNAWVQDEAEILFVDDSIIKIFKIERVPEYRFYVDGVEVSSLLGAHTREDVLAEKQEHFKSSRLYKFPNKPLPERRSK
jgi:hypothetical protein